MTEGEWNSCTSPSRMLNVLQASGKASDRKLRLFACACCRRIWDRFPDPCNRDLVSVVEAHPDGSFDDADIHAAAVASSRREWEFRDSSAYWAAKYLGRGFYKLTPAMSAFVVASRVMLMADEEQSREADLELQCQVAMFRSRGDPPVALGSPLPAAVAAEGERLSALLRDIFGPLLFREPRFDPAWLEWDDGLAWKLAHIAWNDRTLPAGLLEPTRLAVLADALEDAGCADPDILGHLRGPGPHVWGCWALGLLRPDYR